MLFQIFRTVAVSGLFLATTVFGAGALSAQQTGAVTGQVTAEGTGRPLGGAQVAFVDLNIGMLTNNSDGRFLVASVPVGTHEITVTYIGYRTVREQVTVQAGQTSEVDVRLASAAIGLDEIVVTGAGAPTERRRLGQTINSVDASEIALSPVTSVTQALQGRVPGMAGAVGNRETGQADLPVFRGLTSLSQRNTPIIYIDGIRMNNKGFRSAGLFTDQLGQISPNDIERIEVIKGAAAATLFGTEASSGVIQIFTKRGQAGAPSYTFQMDQQAIQMKLGNFPPNAGYDPTTGRILVEDVAEQYVNLGHHQNYTMSIRGGTPFSTYYVSGRLQDEVGAMPNNELMNASLRATLDFNHTDKLSTSIDANILSNRLEAPNPSWGSLASEMMLGNPVNATAQRPHGEQDFTVGGTLKDRDQAWMTTQMLAGGAKYQFTENIFAQAKVGHHRGDRRRERMRPQGEVIGLTGIRQIWSDEITSTTLEASVAWNAVITDRIGSDLVVGGQRFAESSISDQMSVRDFASPTLQTLRGGSAITNLDEFTEEVINAGVFFQEQISLDDRLFITVGARLDGNSAFGEDFGLEWYPKAGLSWVVSDHDFFNVPLVNEFRVRGAFGTSGLQPGAFDAQRTWRPIAFAHGAAVAPLNQGNPDLKPERSTELELALEASLFNERLGFEFIYFNQETTDALLPSFPPPSTGFQASQLRNLGRITTNGLEIVTNLRAMERRGLRLDLNASAAYTDQIVADMGGVPDFRLQTRYRWGHIAEGYAPGAVITPVANPNQPYILTVPIEMLSSVAQILPNTLKNTQGGDSLVWLGNPQPKWTMNFGSTLHLGDNLSLRTLFTGGGGDYILSFESGLIRTATASNLLVAEVRQVLENPNASVEDKRRVADMYGRKHPDLTSNWMEDGDYLALQEVSLIYDLPANWFGRLGLQNTSVSVGGRNLHVWSGYSGIMDPGAAPNGWPAQAGVFNSNIDYMSSPSSRRYTMSLRTSW